MPCPSQFIRLLSQQPAWTGSNFNQSRNELTHGCGYEDAQTIETEVQF
jgi:hypothetical protein